MTFDTSFTKSNACFTVGMLLEASRKHKFKLCAEKEYTSVHIPVTLEVRAQEAFLLYEYMHLPSLQLHHKLESGACGCQLSFAGVHQAALFLNVQHPFDPIGSS